MGAKLSNFEETAAEAIYTENVRQLTELLESVPLEECGRALSKTLPYDEHGRSLLHLAAWSENYELLAAMLRKDPVVDVEDCYEWTPLMVCLYRGNMRSAYALLQQSAQFDPNAKEAKWLLRYAVRRGLTATASFLLERGVKADESASSLLNVAVDTGSVAMTRLLLDKNKCDPNIVDSLGWAPLHIASGHDNLPMVRLLLEFNADVNLKDKNGNTPLAWARRYGSKLVIAELENLKAICDEQWHGSDELPSVYTATTLDYNSGEGSEDDMPSQQDSGASAEEYLDEYRSELWMQTNAEIEAMALMEQDVLYNQDEIDEEYQIDSNVYAAEGYQIEVEETPYLVNAQIGQETLSGAANPHTEQSKVTIIAENNSGASVASEVGYTKAPDAVGPTLTESSERQRSAAYQQGGISEGHAEESTAKQEQGSAEKHTEGSTARQAEGSTEKHADRSNSVEQEEGPKALDGKQAETPAEKLKEIDGLVVDVDGRPGPNAVEETDVHKT